ncbi:MAG: cytochrome c [Anaerolineales bacterium]|nr:cytochrome c [Anaerolineales bacterium]
MFDVVGVLVLFALVALFGFLATRAWKLKNGLLRWGGVVMTGLLAVIPAALLVLALRGFYLLNQRFDNPVADIRVAGTPEQIARGQQLAHLCTSCHTTNGQFPLSGTNFVAKFEMPPLGTLYGPNLTPGGNIADWSDGQLIRAIREGVHKDGRSLLVMPADTLRNLSDDDVQALVAFLRSQPASGEPTPANHFSLLGAIFMNLSDFRTVQPPVAGVSAPPPGTDEYGKYMVDVLGCRSCHGEQLEGKADTGQPGPPPGPNLTHIIPQWTEDQFMTFFNTGQLPDGSSVPILTLSSGFSSPRMPWDEMRASATDDELKAMYAYLHGLPPVDGPAQ